VATTAQRAYRAACPNCGAPVDFLSAASASAVCSFCRSTLVRDGDALRRIGISAELFDDHSPLQLGATGSRQGVAFTLVGRLQYRYSGGTWNEWHALLESGKSAWLSEDNGAYVLAFDAQLPADAPNTEAALGALQAGSRVLADGRAWDVASVLRAELLAAQGELPTAPRLQGTFTVVDLRNGAGEVATLDSVAAPHIHWSVGRSITLAELALQGLKDSSEKTLAGRSLQCPSCGSALAVKLATTQSISCAQCKAVVDVSAGVGADMAHYQQNNAGLSGAEGPGAEPQLALGSTGKLRIAGELGPWQVVGYQERCDVPESSEDETSFWREYLLYNRLLGFAFLVDSNEGWSWVKPITGAPTVRGNSAQWQGKTYTRRYAYAAQSTWVQGEFYWRVKSGERALVVDYEEASGGRLSREQIGPEVTWSAGSTVAAAEVADAFGIAPAARAGLQRDAAPLSSSSSHVLRNLLVAVVLVILVLALISQCSRDRCSDVQQTFGTASAEYQQCQRASGSGGYRTGGGYGGSSGGSYGGNRSSGGGHK
jgi:Domain of unknown function (DUF4178)